MAVVVGCHIAAAFFTTSIKKTMIIRNTKINPNDDEIGFKVAFSHVDCKRWIAEYVSRLLAFGVADQSDSEASIRYYLEHAVFDHFPIKYASQLSRWVVATALRKKYLLVSATDPSMLIFADSIVRKARNTEN